MQSGKYDAPVIYAVLCIITLAVFMPVSRCDFISFDDPQYITANPKVSGGLSVENSRWAFTTGHASNWHPITWLSHMVDCEIFGINPGGHHITNLLLHIINTLLLFALLKKVTGKVWQSGFVAALFALHPMHVESVAWISERKDVLSTMFWLLATAGYIRYARKSSALWYIVTMLLFALGLMAKPMLVTLPFVFLLLDYWPLERFRTKNIHEESVESKGLYGLIIEKVPFFILSAGSSVVTFMVQLSGGAVEKMDVTPLKFRFANSIVAYTKYIGKMFWPTDLAIFYPHPGKSLPLWQVGTSFLLLVTVSVLIIRYKDKYKYLPVGWLWYLGTLVPVIGMVQVGAQAMADRYSYVPFIGLFIIVSWLVPELLQKWKNRNILLGITSAVILCVLSVLTYFQVGYWQNSRILFEHTLKVTENNHIALSHVAESLRKDGRLDEAIELNRKGLQIQPGYFFAHIGLGRAFMEKKQFDKAIVHFTSALKERPDDFNILSCLGIAYGQRGDLDKAVVYFQKAVEVKPDSTQALDNLGHALARQGKFDESLVYLQKTVELDPDAHTSRYHLARVLAKKGKLKQSVEHYKNALQLKPDWPEVNNNLAWILVIYNQSEIHNPAEAIKYAEIACKITNYNNPAFLDTLAACYGSAGQFDEAVKTAQKALELASKTSQEQLANEVESRLNLYKQSKPYYMSLPDTETGD